MNRRIGTFFTAFMVAAALAVPVGAHAASAAHTYTIATRMIEQSPGVGEFDGSLALHVSPDGIISGYYRPDDNPRFVAVTGGVSGSSFWLDIGTFSPRPWHFSGTFKNGTIDATSNTPIVDEGYITGLDLIGTPKPASR